MFDIRDGHHRPIGRCISKLLSNINHNCQPNAVIACPEGLDVGNPLRVILTEDVLPDEEASSPI
jgi:hypothetical protein